MRVERVGPEQVRRGLPRPVGVGLQRLEDGRVPPLLPDEEAYLPTRANERRRRYFALGRAAARAALAEFGAGAGLSIGRGEAGEPLWPPGIVGAITHAGETAIALVGGANDYAGLGVDVEELARAPSPRAARLVCTAREMEWVDGGVDTRRLLMLFSAKEAIFKALFPIERVWLGFGDAELVWLAERDRFEARLLKAAGAGLPVGSVLQVYCAFSATQVLSTTYCLPR